jgi:hypothetical protein
VRQLSGRQEQARIKSLVIVRSHAKNRRKLAHIPRSIIEQLNSDPRMPEDFNIYKELHIDKQSRHNFVKMLHDFVQDPAVTLLMKDDNPENFYDLAVRFLSQETLSLFWPSFVVETEHKWFRELYAHLASTFAIPY